MQINLIRQWFYPEATIGELYIDDLRFSYTLEDAVRDVKIQDETAIPYGTYKVTIERSNRLGKFYPTLHNVPNFQGILIHAGNDENDTKGCILVGYDRVGLRRIARSTQAKLDLTAKIQNALDNGEEVWITITQVTE